MPVRKYTPEKKAATTSDFDVLFAFRYTFLALYRAALVEENGIKTVDPRGHECTQECEGVESTIQRGLWICLSSGTLHVCGSSCDLRQTCGVDASHEIAEACPLSGTVFSRELINDELAFSGNYSVIARSPFVHEDTNIRSVVLCAQTGARIDEHTFAAYRNRARVLIQKVICSNDRKKVDRLRVDELYSRLGDTFKTHIDQQSKLGRGPSKNFVCSEFLKLFRAMTSIHGNVEYGNQLQPFETNALIDSIAQRAASLWAVFLARLCHESIVARNKNRKPSLDYHVLATLYTMRTGVRSDGRVWLVRCPALKRLLPAEGDLEKLGFNRQEFGKNMSYFRHALSCYHGKPPH